VFIYLLTYDIDMPVYNWTDTCSYSTTAVSTGSRPLQSKGSVVSVRKTADSLPGDWSYEVSSVMDRSVTLKVTSSADAIVGRYEMFIDSIHAPAGSEVEKHRYKHPDDIYLLFNPWNEGENTAGMQKSGLSGIAGNPP
jgi:hypothetical protein